MTINGRQFTVSAMLPLTYRDIADLAGYRAPATPTLTVHSPASGLDVLVLHPGAQLAPSDGLVFCVYDASHT